MGLKCEDVWRDVSSYIDGDLDPAQQREMTQHFGECKGCQAILDGVRNVVSLYGNENLFAPSAGFHGRLHHWLTERVEGPKGSWWGWAATAGLVGAFAAWMLVAAVHDRGNPELRAPMSDPARHTPQQLVAVVEDGKLFHDPSCPAIHGKYRMVTPEEAIREGYTPCSRCLGEDLRNAGRAAPVVELGENRTTIGDSSAKRSIPGRRP